jgi:DNA polymerase-3 subunit gamma/tau
MDSTTFYRKYRPQTFAELDLTEVRTSLISIFAARRFPQALLFAGPKGTGKTSAARLIAKAVNCLHLRRGEPCNHCPSCLAVNAGTDLDLIEIDAASNRGIDDIRELRNQIKLAPVKNRYKVYIIDEAHMLTNEAFNALLKTLEEPPPHALFILCTTDLHKLPDTIISRCLRFTFRRATLPELLRSLAKVVDQEKLVVEDGVLASIAQAADGSFRDAQKLLEQLSLGHSKITLVAAQQLLGQDDSTNPARFIALLKLKKSAELLQEIARLVQNGVDFDAYLLRLLHHLRLDLVNNLDLLKLFLPVAAQLKTSPLAPLPLEIAVVDYCQGVGMSSSKSSNPLGPLVPPKPSAFSSRPLPAHFWPDLLAAVHPQNHSVEGLLRSARPLKLEDDCLTIEVFYKFHREQLTVPKCREIVERAASQLLGRTLKLKCVLGTKSDILDIAKEIFK